VEMERENAPQMALQNRGKKRGLKSRKGGGENNVKGKEQ